MVICIIALVAFGLLSIFSAAYRPLAKEAFDCVFKMVTLRPCDTGFERRLKGKITGGVFRRSPKLAGVIHKNFELLSWIFTLAFFASLVYSVYGLYNFFAYGNCNGANSSEICTLSQFGVHAECFVVAGYHIYWSWLIIMAAVIVFSYIIYRFTKKK
jgi:hypothetical protein